MFPSAVCQWYWHRPNGFGIKNQNHFKLIQGQVKDIKYCLLSHMCARAHTYGDMYTHTHTKLIRIFHFCSYSLRPLGYRVFPTILCPLSPCCTNIWEGLSQSDPKPTAMCTMQTWEKETVCQRNRYKYMFLNRGQNKGRQWENINQFWGPFKDQHTSWQPEIQESLALPYKQHIQRVRCNMKVKEAVHLKIHVLRGIHLGENWGRSC